MNYFRILVFALLAGTGLSCSISTAPKNDLGFARVKDLAALSGCYRNAGEGEGEGKRYLSALIWPREQLAHERIVAVRVVFEEPRNLRVAALSKDGIAKEEVFVEGADFYLASGRITLQSESVASFAYPAGNVFIGVAHQSKTVGIDSRGDARVRESDTFLGAAFVVIPIAGNVRDTFRFPRSPELCDERQHGARPGRLDHQEATVGAAP